MILRLFICAILQLCIIGLTSGLVPQITRLNVQCDRTGMKVMVEFDNTFNGIIFSKGHFSDPNCRYVNAASGRNQFEFFVSSTACGTLSNELIAATKGGQELPQGFKNVIIIQNDPDYQEVWDSARRLSCDWVTRLEKTVTFAPFGVDMLGVKELRFPGDTVDCWMDIQRGHGPFSPTVGGVVPIGERLTVVIYVRDSDSSFDVHVKDCYAYDTPDYRNPNAHAIKLTDEQGCPLKEKLVQGFFRTRDVRNSGATIIAYGIINAFKFPEKMDVFLACNVEVCKGGCTENQCQPIVEVAGQDPAATAAANFGETTGTDQTLTDDSASATSEATSAGDSEDDEEKKDEDETGTESSGGDDEGGDNGNGDDAGNEESNGSSDDAAEDGGEEATDSDSTSDDAGDEDSATASEESNRDSEADGEDNGDAASAGDEESATEDADAAEDNGEEKDEKADNGEDSESTTDNGGDEADDSNGDSNSDSNGDSNGDESEDNADSNGEASEDNGDASEDNGDASEDNGESNGDSSDASNGDSNGKSNGDSSDESNGNGESNGDSSDESSDNGNGNGDEEEESTDDSNGDDDNGLTAVAPATKGNSGNNDVQTKEGDEAELTNGDDEDETEEERKKRKISAALKLKAKKSKALKVSSKKVSKVKKLNKLVSANKPKVQKPIASNSTAKLVKKPVKKSSKKPTKNKKSDKIKNKSSSSKSSLKTKALSKKPSAKLVAGKKLKSSSSSSARLVRKTTKPKTSAKKVGKVSKAIVNSKKVGQLKSANNGTRTQKSKIRRPSSSSSSAKLTTTRSSTIRQVRSTVDESMIMPIELRRLSSALRQHPNAGIVQEGRHVRTRRSVLINETTAIMNATFAPMMHSIQIISPIEDFDEKELNAWEKLMQLEGSAEEVSHGVDYDVTRIPSFTIATTSITSNGISELNGQHSYCFTRTHLITASILLSSITIILSMILYMVCSYIYQRQMTNNKLSYISNA